VKAHKVFCRILVGIAEVKELCNSPHQKEAPNRIAKKETTVVPKAKIDCIKDALKH
jgi:hypothetical protein